MLHGRVILSAAGLLVGLDRHPRWLAFGAAAIYACYARQQIAAMNDSVVQQAKATRVARRMAMPHRLWNLSTAAARI